MLQTAPPDPERMTPERRAKHDAFEEAQQEHEAACRAIDEAPARIKREHDAACRALDNARAERAAEAERAWERDWELAMEEHRRDLEDHAATCAAMERAWRKARAEHARDVERYDAYLEAQARDVDRGRRAAHGSPRVVGDSDPVFEIGM